MNRKTAQEHKCVLDKKLKGKILRVEVAIVLSMIWKCLHWETRHQKVIPRVKLCCAQNSHLRLPNHYSCWMTVTILFDAVASAATCFFLLGSLTQRDILHHQGLSPSGMAHYLIRRSHFCWMRKAPHLMFCHLSVTSLSLLLTIYSFALAYT